MDGQVLLSVFANAALPQKVVIVLMAAATLAVLAAGALELRRPGSGPWRGLIGVVRLVAPMLGLLVGAMNGFHMARTIQRLPFDVTAKHLAPGILEISVVVGLGALAGLVGCATLCLLNLATSAGRGRTP